MDVVRPGDIGVVRTHGLAAWFIRFGTHSPVNHAFVYVGRGLIVEAKPDGAVLGHLSEYRDVTWLSLDLPDATRVKVVTAALSLRGREYGWLDIVALALDCYGFRSRWIFERVERTDRLICSQLCDLAYRMAGVELFHDGRLPCEVTPGDLYDLARSRATRD